jgi:predicted RNase H-like HicB family nuclease
MGRSLAVSASASGSGHIEQVVIAVTFTELAGSGWIAEAPEIRSVAQGETEAEAVSNLLELVHEYPELLDEVHAAQARRVELVAV